MRKRVALIGLLAAVVTAGILVAVPSTAGADSDHAAILIHKDAGLACGMLGANADGNPIGGGLGVVQLTVQNDNKVTLVCKGTGLTNLSGRAQSFSAFACGILLPSGGSAFTTDTHATVAPNGNGTLWCTFTF